MRRPSAELNVHAVTSEPTFSTGGILKRILANDYLQARGEAFDRQEHMDEVVAMHEREYQRKQTPESVHMHVVLWLAFMAGSDWERSYRGRRYTNETTSTV